MGSKPFTIAAFVLLAWSNIASAALPPPTTLDFSGYQWNVRSGSGGPGPNNWSDQNVYVDPSTGYLHLQLTYSNGSWYAAELVSQQAFGFGTYQWQLQGQPTPLDPNVVFGMFNYGPPTLGPDGTNEIDIEFASFDTTGATPTHGNWTVWPAVAGAPMSPTTQFSTAPAVGANTQRFTWSSTQVAFQALSGITDTNSGEYANWTYAPSDYLNRIPQQAMPVHMNLWLLGGNAPTDGQNVEVVVSSFKFTPLSPAPEPGSAPLMTAGICVVWAANRRRKNTNALKSSSA